MAKSDKSGSCWSRAVRMPSVTTSSRVSRVARFSNRMCQPTSRPSVHSRSSAIRRATARAATRRGCSRMSGTRVDQGRRNPGGLARAGRRGEHHGAPARERVADVRDVLVNDQRSERSQRPQRRRSHAPREARGHPDRGRGNADRLRRDRSSCRRTGCGCAIDR